MSTVAFGALTTRREKSDSGTSKSSQPPGLNSYIDVLAALVPAEVLAIHAVVIAAATTTSRGQTQITQPGTLRLAFWLLVGLSTVLFVLGRRPAPTPTAVLQQSRTSVPHWQHLEWQDLVRAAIPPAAFVGWTMLEPASVWNVVVPDMSSETRTLIALVGAVFLAAVTKALASHADNKLSPAQQAARATLLQAALPRPGPAPAITQPTGEHLPPASEIVPAAPPPAAPPPIPNGIGPEVEPSVPKWVY